MSKEVFLVMSNQVEEGYSVVKDINRSMTTATTFKKAYTLALFISDIKDPDHTYRQALKVYNQDLHVYIKAKDDHDDITLTIITKIKLH